MREHIGLFRGKRIDDGKWVEGNLVNYRPHLPWVHIVWFDNSEEGVLKRFEEDVDPDTIGECTGLKDKNGKLIFEGDIVRILGDHLPHWFDDGENTRVEYSDGGYSPFDQYDSDCGKYVYAKDCEIIGNIHDTELLKGGEG